MSEYIYDEREIYYVYKWYNVDTNFVFYVGKGKKGRYKELSTRNKYFKYYHKNNNCDVEILYSNMSEKDAFDKEIKMIKYYKDMKQCTCNLTEGGDGGPIMFGEDNPMFGKTHSLEIREKISRILKENGSVAGEKNAMFGVSPKERMDEETYNNWKAKHKINNIGNGNPNFGNRKLSKIYAEDREYAKEKQSRPGLQNGRCLSVKMFNERGFYMEFDYMTLCAEYMIKNNICRGKDTVGVVAYISKAAKQNKKYFGYNFKFLEKEN